MLHPSVAVRWWLHHLPSARLAQDFLYREMGAGAISCAAPVTFEADVLRAVASDLRGTSFAGSIAALLFSDITKQVRLLVQGMLLGLIEARDLAAQALLHSTFHALSYDDAVYLELAASSGRPLLIAGRQLYQQASYLAPTSADWPSPLRISPPYPKVK